MYWIFIIFLISLYTGFPLDTRFLLFINNFCGVRDFLYKGFSFTMDFLIYGILLYKRFVLVTFPSAPFSASALPSYVKPIVKYYVRDYARKSILVRSISSVIRMEIRTVVIILTKYWRDNIL